MMEVGLEMNRTTATTGSSHKHNNNKQEAATTADTKPNRSIAGSGGGKKMMMGVRYRECMRNHAASIGGHANDGCGEFMPAASSTTNAADGDDHDLLMLRCAACGCHRNFHRKEIPPPPPTPSSPLVDLLHNQFLHLPPPLAPQPVSASAPGSMLFYNHIPPPTAGVGVGLAPTPTSSSHKKSTAAGVSSSQFYHQFGAVDLRNENKEEDRRSETPDQMRDDEEEAVTGVRFGGNTDNNYSRITNTIGTSSCSSKRFRTKFTQEQKEKMMDFAERIGWRIQKHDHDALANFCLENGIKRNVLKVWMHNNKNTLRKRDQPHTNPHPHPHAFGAATTAPTSIPTSIATQVEAQQGKLSPTSSSPSSLASPSSSPPPQPNSEAAFQSCN